ncbi:thiamine-phosphate kinase [Methylophaga sp.]|uniref:thiamine-phosphate kinase n=1 Tax=Methylophaga sp. TaxID=2024840 RepID=UPI003F69FDB3
MALSEFSLIQQFFTDLTLKRDDVVLGVGDDCALLQCPDELQLAVSIDTLVENVHFFSDVCPQTLGHKSLAVSLSDLAAMGATPAWFTLALTLPELDENWLKEYATGLSELAKRHNIQLVGGDTTRGPLSISIQVHGFVEKNQSFRRDGANTGDLIFVSGTLGDAGAALKQQLENWTPPEFDVHDKDYLKGRLEMPTPRNDLVELLKHNVSAAIDISDGLLADLGHILQKSHKGAFIQLDKLPLSSSLQRLPLETASTFALNSGDDYELCFTVPADKAEALMAKSDLLTCIGEITDSGELIVLDQQGQPIQYDTRKGYDHFGA